MSVAFAIEIRSIRIPAQQRNAGEKNSNSRRSRNHPLPLSMADWDSNASRGDSNTMHTLIVIGSGLFLLGFALLTGNWTSAGVSTAALVFIPVWLALSAVNLWLGVTRAGYSVPEELPILAVVFAIPAIVALVAWWFFRTAR